MKRKYEVRWYEYNLTEERRRRFFTKIAATLFAKYLKSEMIECKIYEYPDNHGERD